MAHVGAVRQVVRAERPREQLVHKRSLVGRPAGSIEIAPVSRGGSDMFTDKPERLSPGDRRIVRFPGRDHHRFAQPDLDAQPILRLSGKVGDGMLGPEVRADGAEGVFLAHGLGAVFAELGGLASSCPTPATRTPGSRNRPAGSIATMTGPSGSHLPAPPCA